MIPVFADRKNTNSLKYDGMEPLFGAFDLEPYWVADMDFEAPVAVLESLKARLKHSVYGYPVVDDGFFEAVSYWFSKRFGITVCDDKIVPMTGVAASMFTSILAFSGVGDGVVIQPPVYGPFYGVVRSSGRDLIENPLLKCESGYEIDFDGLERIFADKKPKILLFCSPHNPVGRVWSTKEIKTVVGLCEKYGVFLVSDEIHFDIVFAGNSHTSVLKFADMYDNIVLLSAPTKTFNIPGLNVSYAIIPSKNNKKKFEYYAKNLHQTLPNTFGIEALKAAYMYGGEWIDGCVSYLNQNRTAVKNFVEKNSFIDGFTPEGTYLYWLDFSAVSSSQAQISETLKKSGIALSGGDFFFGGRESTFFRLNFATTHERVGEALDKIERAFCF